PDPGHLRSHDLEQAVGEALLRFVREMVVVEVRDLLGLPLGGRHELRHAVAEAGDHGPARAGVQDPATVGREEPHPLAALDARVLEVEKPGEDARVVRPDRLPYHSRPPLGPSQPTVRGSSAAFRPRTRATSFRKRSSRCRAMALLWGMRRRLSSSSASGSTPSASSSCRYTRTQSSMISDVTSGWNCTPRLRPIAYACGDT